ncbi:TetR/AcrR family transcriptional regulator [Streptomyces chrestomyceticus]|uniref:TetR/AcrR family transcriptional regulator n=1 Tax=Streptomyces chrestomyceticus TaxID=68185 RepID=A0ABU7WQD8_9ACTN
MVEEHGRSGRPRSERARTAVLNAVDDLLVEVGYAALTMKGIAERAGVGRQTVYRWWSNKAEVLYEASAIDARKELSVPLSGDPARDFTAYLDALVKFLAHSDAGAAYRALVGEAQHDTAVAALLSSGDILGESATKVVEPALDASGSDLSVEQATALLVGPPFFHILSGRSVESIDTRRLAEEFTRVLVARRRQDRGATAGR